MHVYFKNNLFSKRKKTEIYVTHVLYFWYLFSIKIDAQMGEDGLSGVFSPSLTPNLMRRPVKVSFQCFRYSMHYRHHLSIFFKGGRGMVK